MNEQVVIRNGGANYLMESWQRRNGDRNCRRMRVVATQLSAIHDQVQNQSIRRPNQKELGKISI